MAYQSWSVVFGEQPSASKWGILGTNDASFNDGTGIFGLYKNLLAVDSNPYKFKAYRNAAYTPANSTITKYPWDAEEFDTNNNFDTTNNRYVCPVSGFYYFSTHMQTGTTTARILIMLYKNGAEHNRLFDINVSASQTNGGGSTIVQAAAGDYFEIFYFMVNVSANAVGNSLQQSFEGFLISRT